jgi:tRNA threonylcarbamoyladenosine biosynthesis protein TsaE
MNYNISDISTLSQCAENIAKTLQKGDALCLKGTLGAGKTTLAKEIITKLNEEITYVTSPTYNILCEYDSSKGIISHFDLYRINHKIELEEIGLYEALHNNISIIEWPEIAFDIIKKYSRNSIECNITFKNTERYMQITGLDFK